MALQTNGQIIIGGSFTNYNHLSAGGIARLNSDGSFDYDFDPGTGVQYVGLVRATVYSLGLQSDGKVVLGGAFNSVNGVSGGANGDIERLLGGTATPALPNLLYWPLAPIAESGETFSIDILTGGSKPLFYQWFFNGETLPGATNAALQFATILTNQAGDYSVAITNHAGSITSPPISLKVIPTINLAQSLGEPDWTWNIGGDRNWYGQTAVSHDGMSAAQSGPILNNQQSILATGVSGPGRLKFWWKVSSELDYDLLDFYVNDRWQDELSGEIDWTQRTILIPPGQSMLTWVYSKDLVTSVGQDAGWVAEVAYTPAPVLSAASMPDGRIQLSVQTLLNQVVQIQASTTLTNWTTIAVLTNASPPLVFTEDTATHFDARFYRVLMP